ncbi:uncharacterized protein LTR77_008869 [Saxophila tyrrhenica]|uniref:Uncharacterized protein n=1 Tax=Saxophila tyrrhenica TaxID=1690608 RepID=A0AAV9P2D8_9PEZI|nr:hypothetical protein LTR77_008869 [Saxophila tyrrhenica]
MPRIIILGTCDTKLPELLSLRSHITTQSPSAKITLVDAGRSPIKHQLIDIPQDTLTSTYAPSPNSPQDLSSLPRGEVIHHMITCATNWLREAYEYGLKDPSAALHGIIAAGGTGNTALASAVMRAVLPIGFPKLIVSTNASADVSHVVGETDVCMMPSIVDIAGSNELLERILGNAAGAVVGMAGAYEAALNDEDGGGGKGKGKKRVGLSMFGVTTPAVDRIRMFLERNYGIECFVFHQTGAGGKAMERLVEEGGLDAVLDVTTTELCDHLCGGVMDSGPRRLEAALKAGIPYVISCGALDMCNFGPKETVPERYRGRKLFEHNPTVTLMRTSVEESRAIAEFIVEKVKTHTKRKDLVKVVLPLGGVSMIAVPDGPFYDAEADDALFSTLRDGLKDSGVEVVEDPRAVNDEGFAVDAAKMLVAMMGLWGL